MFFDEIIHGTQYYRAPTPLPEEWETDIPNLEKLNIGAFQIRINWRWNERREDEYDFSDIDRLLELAEQNNQKVIMKFLLECAPQYVFEKYGGTRIGSKGELLRPGSHGAFYGGWLPCFTNPYVQERAIKFVEKIVQRYAGNKNIILWHTWNEIRNRPIDECFCPHCRKAFGKYLENKFGTIENLNSFYHTAEESFETINLPVMAHGFWDIYEFKKFKGGVELGNYLKFVYDAIRRHDSTRPIMSHVGVTCGFQESINDVCNDFEASKNVDFWGTSLPLDTAMTTHDNRVTMMMLCDFVRCVDENYFVHEIYPGLGMFKDYNTEFDMKYKLYSALSTGAKGLVYWQYRAERLGMENDCAGIMRMDGTPRPPAIAASKFGADLKNNMEYFAKSKVEKAQIGIVYDFDSALIGEIEENCIEDFNFKLRTNLMYYRNAHMGLYKLVRDANYNVDYLSTTKPELFADYKVLFFPYYTMLDEKLLPYIQAFLEKGGIIYADEGFGMRQLNTWMQPYDIACKPIMNAKLLERRYITDESIDCFGSTTPIAPYKSQYVVENAKTHLSFADSTPALQSIEYGKGKLYLSGFSMGFTYHDTRDKCWLKVLELIMQGSNVDKYEFADFENCVYERRMSCGEHTIIFIFNNSDESKTFDLKGKIPAHGADAVIDGSNMTVGAGLIGYAVVE